MNILWSETHRGRFLDVSVLDRDLKPGLTKYGEATTAAYSRKSLIIIYFNIRCRQTHGMLFLDVAVTKWISMYLSDNLNVPLPSFHYYVFQMFFYVHVFKFNETTTTKTKNNNNIWNEVLKQLPRRSQFSGALLPAPSVMNSHISDKSSDFFRRWIKETA